MGFSSTEDREESEDYDSHPSSVLMEMQSGLSNSKTSPPLVAGLTCCEWTEQICERINPSTGKPYNTIFSRPYDLTRHEDTIHNARKLKVHYPLCTEEKTFSRNDALTRHLQVVHPEHVEIQNVLVEDLPRPSALLWRPSIYINMVRAIEKRFG
ncbi:hypothetical protein HYFRA_00011422 [Hymenoscyphus fraxineus]|uniref:C2H2-type domain-containing protein n=1 Tax=Hymenoscyphus fraxineus TaxID=746836 RepID=A0A9N9PRZ3_9HELO|nr:hypothetical protein HYFRA_00011422 [Hymenoscyphus fraxineus]